MPWPSLSLLIPINPGRRQAGIISQHAELGSDGYQQLRDFVSQAGVPVLPSLPSAFPATAALGFAPVPFPLVPHSLCPSSSLSVGHRQRWLTGKCITGSGRKGEKSGRLGHETVPSGVRRLIHKNCRILLQGLFVRASISCFLSISLSLFAAATPQRHHILPLPR